MTDPTSTSPTPSLLHCDWKKELVLVRGLPGSGKTTLARKLTGYWPNDEFPRVVEADNFFEVDGNYRWHGDLRDLAHQWSLSETFRRLLRHQRVAVANTFIKRWQIIRYIEIARQFQIRVWLLEPEGHSLPRSVLAERNVHEVPLQKIEQMMLEWEEMTQEEVDILLGLPADLRGQKIQEW